VIEVATDPRICARLDDGLEKPALVWSWPSAVRCISTAPLGGGIGERVWVVNAEVPSSYARRDPDAHLMEVSASLGLFGTGVGMLTAADVRRVTSAFEHGARVWATVGLGHPVLAAGASDGELHLRDATQGSAISEVGTLEVGTLEVGTINVVAVLPVRLSDAALVNAVSTITEAKVQALYDSGLEATGTATDAICVACDPDAESVCFAGPRSQWGSRLARAAHGAILHGASEWTKG